MAKSNALILLIILTVSFVAVSVPAPARRKIPMGVQTQEGEEKLVTAALEDQLKPIERALKEQVLKISNSLQFLRPISSKYIFRKNGITLIVKYQINPVQYFHVKVSPPSQAEKESNFKILGISGPKSNYEPLLVF